MKSGDMVYYRLSEKDVERANKLFRFPASGRQVVLGETLPALVITAYGCIQEGDAGNIGFFSGIVDLKVFLPMSLDLWVQDAELDENPIPAPPDQQYGGSLLVYPAHGKFTTVEPPPLI